MAEEQQPTKQPQPQDERAASRESREKRTPGTDMQDVDAGTADSGQPPGPRTTPAQSVMKQEQKTDHEAGNGG